VEPITLYLCLTSNGSLHSYLSVMIVSVVYFVANSVSASFNSPTGRADSPSDLSGHFPQSSRDKYSSLMQNSSFDSVLESIRGFARLDSRESAIDFLWTHNHVDISNFLFPRRSPMAVKFGINSTLTVDESVQGLKEIVTAFLSLREDLLSWIEDGCLKLADDQAENAFRAIGLLASSDVLKKLILSNVNIPDLTVLSGLVSLTVLRLYNVPVENLDAIASLVNMEVLYLVGAPVSDLRPLACLVNLQYLYLLGSRVSDLRPLSRLARLRVLDLSRCPVEDVSALVVLTKLRVMYLSGTLVQDLSPLACLLENSQSKSGTGLDIFV